MTKVKPVSDELLDDLPGHVMSLLGQVLDGFRRELAQRGTPPQGLRSSQLRLLSMTPAEGMRVTDLAERVGMTKQALGEFATALEQQGLLESVGDPADGRVRILRPTAQGNRAVRASERQIDDLEAQWRDRLGHQKWDQLRELLREAAALSPRRRP